MKLSSFIAITAAGLAVALPVHPTPTGLTNPLKAEKKLTVEPSETVAKRQIDALTSGLPLARRQLDGLLPSSDDSEEKDVEPKEPKEPKDPKEPVDPTEDGKTTIEEDNLVQSTGDLSKRQLDGIMKMLSGEKDEEKKPAANATAPATAPAEKSAAPAEKSAAPEPKESEAAPAKEESKGGLAGILKRQLGGLPGTSASSEDSEESTDLVSPKKLIPIRRQLEGLLDKSRNESTPPAPEEDADTDAAPADKKTADEQKKPAEDEAAPAKEDAAAVPSTDDATSSLGGILRRQLDGLLGKDKDAEEEAPAEEDAAAEPAATEEEPAADDAAAPAEEEPIPEDKSILGQLGMTQQSQARKAQAAEAE